MSSEAQPPIADDIAISVRNLTKSYRLFSHPGDRIKQFLSLGLKRYHREFTALKDVSFDIKKGETVGIIGRNGSGKSTLLQLISGILKPASGSVTVNGKVSALLELGAGFNPEFTGRENVYFQGALSGLSLQEIRSRLPLIEAFADIGQFIDQPVRTYSSGMFVRLAFSSMIHTNSEILIIDEALGVGDEAFQRKCIDYLMQLRERKQLTLLYVSHNLRQIEALCSQVLLLKSGELIHDGTSVAGCLAYRAILQEEEKSISSATEHMVGRITEIKGRPASTIESNENNAIDIFVTISITEPIEDPEISLTVYADNLFTLGSVSTLALSEKSALLTGENHFIFTLLSPPLLPGRYRLGLYIRDRYQCSIYENPDSASFNIYPDPAKYSQHLPRGSVNFSFEFRNMT